MANSFVRIEKYMQNAIDTVFAVESKTRVLENGAKFMDVNFKEAGYVKVMSLLMDGLSDYYRVNGGSTGTDYVHYQNGSADGYRKGNSQGTWEIFQLSYDRGKQFQVDNMDNEETAGLVIGNLLTEFLRTKVVPEIDAVRFSKMAAKCSATLGNLVAESISANTIISKFNTAYEWLSDHEVPAEEQVIFVSPAVMTLIRNTTELYKRLSQTEYKGDVSFTIDTYEGRPIIEVPTNRFFTAVAVGDNGYYAASGSKVINFMVCSKRAIIPIVKLEKSKIWTPDQVQDFDGYKVNFRLYHDVIIPKNKIAGIYTSVSTTTATTKTNLLSVDISMDQAVVSTTPGEYTVNEYFTNPAGLLGDLVHSASAITVGANVAASIGTTIKKINVGESFTGLDLTTEYYAIVDAAGNVLAATGAITLPTT